jgi:hypothetical protein
LEKAIEFAVWLKQMIGFIREHGEQLTDTLKHKLTETLLFIQSFDCARGQVEVEFVENYLKFKAEKTKNKEKKLRTEERKRESDEESEYGSEQQRSSRAGSNRSSMSANHAGATQNKEQARSVSSEQGKGHSANKRPDGMPATESKVQFSDFDILQCIGEGSFGRVYKGRQKDTGDIFALKVMKKQFLINNNQVKYAVSEA